MTDNWQQYYGEFAKCLLKYKNNRSELIKYINDMYVDLGINMPTLDKDKVLIDIDPFSVFGLFNKNSMKTENRINIIKYLSEKMGLIGSVPTNFDGVPTLNNQNAIYYSFTGWRGDNDIDELWELFEVALDYSDNKSIENEKKFIKNFDLAVNKKGNGNSKITMGLYWIAPRNFLNLDSRNEWYIYESGKLPKEFVELLPVIDSNKISGEKYLQIQKAVEKYIQNSNTEFNDFKELSEEAWNYSNQVNEENRQAQKKLEESAKKTPENDGNEESLEGNAVKVEEENKPYNQYTSNEFLSEVYIDEDVYFKLVDLVKMKKNVILQGAPGVGKTFVAKRLAYSMIGTKDDDRVTMVQFHQSYSYEDFIEGFRPISNGMSFDIKKGIFYKFCDKARKDLERDYFFIIDEINRGNLSKIFGELFMLIESDKRGEYLPLIYSEEKFSIPVNVHIIGLMNTADRSLAMLDYALRRRFAFFTMEPGFSTDGFEAYRNSLNNDKFNKLVDVVQSLNYEIKNDETLGEGFYIGHSFFCNIKELNDQVLSNIVEYELIPLLKEYWFDSPSKVNGWAEKMKEAIK